MSYRAFWQRRCRAATAGAVLKPSGGNCAVLPKLFTNKKTRSSRILKYHSRVQLYPPALFCKIQAGSRRNADGFYRETKKRRRQNASSAPKFSVVGKHRGRKCITAILLPQGRASRRRNTPARCRWRQPRCCRPCGPWRRWRARRTACKPQTAAPCFPPRSQSRRARR